MEFFETHSSITGFCNTGGFGIDGIMSSFIGASFMTKNKLYFCVIGDLAFFYDMNVLGNRHIKSNIRIMLINNGKGTEFRIITVWNNKFSVMKQIFILPRLDISAINRICL